MEFIATITVTRSARGEGDVPVVIVAASGSAHNNGGPADGHAIAQALADADAVIQAALGARDEVRNA